MIHNLRTHIENMTEFPAMPELARKILGLGRDPDARALAAVVELDPSIAGQLVRYATSPFFGYGGKINSIRDAISRVLGIQRTMNIALGAATGRAFKGPAQGAVGRNAVWLHAVYSAALMQSLAGKAAPPQGAIVPGIAYLCGLVHNIGFLLLGHLYPEDVRTLNQTLRDDPETSVTAVERKLFWTDHTQYGSWLLAKWRMPAEVVTTVREHHSEDYEGEHAVYVHLCILADRLMQRLEIGDARITTLPPQSLTCVGIDEETLLALFQRTLESRSDLDQLAESLAGA